MPTERPGDDKQYDRNCSAGRDGDGDRDGGGGGGDGDQELEINICGKTLLVVGHHDKQVLLCTSLGLSLKLPPLHNRPLYYHLSVTTFDFGRNFAEISFLMKLPLETGAENSKFQVKLSELS